MEDKNQIKAPHTDSALAFLATGPVRDAHELIAHLPDGHVGRETEVVSVYDVFGAPALPPLPQGGDPKAHQADYDKMVIRLKKAKIERYKHPHPLTPVNLLDPNYQFDFEAIRWLMYAWMNNVALQLVGVHGAGKTSHIMQFLIRMNAAPLVVSCHGNMEASDLLGDYVVMAGSNGQPTMRFRYGPVPLAMMKNFVVVFEERDSMPAECNLALNNVLDGMDLLLPNHFNELVKRGEAVRFLASANTAGVMDESGLYNTSRVQSASSNSRWLVKKIGFMAESMELAMLKKAATDEDGTQKISDDMLDKFLKFATATRVSAESGKGMEYPLCTRELKLMISATLTVGSAEKAVEVCYFSKLSSVDRDVAEKAWQHVFGKKRAI